MKCYVSYESMVVGMVSKEMELPDNFKDLRYPEQIQMVVGKGHFGVCGLAVIDLDSVGLTFEQVDKVLNQTNVLHGQSIIERLRLW